MSDLISIIVPVYNVEKYLEDCINSILNQTYKNFELILVDDGSTDGSSYLCDKLKKIDNRIIVIHQYNQGLSAARNSGLEICSGKFITFVDSDDMIDENYCYILLNSSLKFDADISLVGYKCFKSNNELIAENCLNYEIETISNVEACKRLYSLNGVKYITAWGKLYKAELFNNIRFPVKKIHEDEFVNYILYYNANLIVNSNLDLYFYRENPNGISRISFSIKRYDGLEALSFRLDYFERCDEKDLVDLTRKKLEFLIAKYSILSRSEKIYKDVPEKYKMNLFKATKILYSSLSKDEFEYILSKVYPRSIRILSYIKNIHFTNQRRKNHE